jgi:ABC-2 type transport system permease protein
MKAIFFKEVNGFLNSLIAYLVISVFLCVTSLVVWFFPETSIIEYGYADASVFFQTVPFIFIFLIPAITMRSFSEERKSGTIELLFTKPLTDWDIIFGKYFAALLLVVIALVPTLIYMFSISRLGNPIGNLDISGITGSYIGLVFLAAVFTAIGIWVSVITKNQIVAFITAAFICFIFFQGFESASGLVSNGVAALWVKQLGLFYHYQSVGKGMIDTRDVVFLFSATGIFLFLTKITLAARKW